MIIVLKFLDFDCYKIVYDKWNKKNIIYLLLEKMILVIFIDEDIG